MSEANAKKSTSAVRLLAYVVMAHGLLIIVSTLIEQITIRDRPHITLHHVFAGAPLLLGLTLIDLGLYLRRQKQTAWIVATAVYSFYFIIGCARLFLLVGGHRDIDDYLLRDVLIPGFIVSALALSGSYYKVKSDIRSFAVSLRFSGIILLVAFLYGVIGFSLLEKADFHRSISLLGAIHYTIDQVGLTTKQPLMPYSHRARLFIDSLSTISIGALAYAFISLFQPLRARFSGQTVDRELAQSIMLSSGGGSEDFFKIWPHDKLYFFDRDRNAGLAYAVHRGVALVVGDPFGHKASFDQLLSDFDELCRVNDWAVSYIHTEPAYSGLYKRRGLTLQKIGEEAVLDLKHFNSEVRKNKYFRQIENRFTKQGYSCEIHMPPHSEELLNSLKVISDQWLSLPGRVERGFMMGSFGNRYMQGCELVVLRDSEGVPKGFLNQITSFDPSEANFDLLRHSKDAPGNSNDFIMMAFIDHVSKQGFERLNLGLCPLSGLDIRDEERSVIDNALQFLYSNGNRFYSFAGLRRFKAKYDPEWHARYIAYRGGIRGFTKILNALNRAMKVSGKY